MSAKVPVDLLPIDEEIPPLFREAYAQAFKDPPDLEQPGPSGYNPEDTDHVQNIDTLSFEISSAVIGSIISQPFIVLRRQCQVNRKALRYHLTPFTLIPVLLKLKNRQGFLCLWKGRSGIFILRGCTFLIEYFLDKITPFPREVKANSSLKQLSQHLLLKLITYGILTPFYCSSLAETVQSDIASEKPGELDCIKEGVCRLFKLGTPRSSRLLPMWQLVGPSALFGVSSYVLSSLIQSVFRWYRSLRKRNAQENVLYERPTTPSSSATYLDNLSILHFSSFLASVALYPAETIVHRLYLQGTRIIIDDLDSGTSVLPVISTYEGVVDCFHTIVSEEGASGLYKGFGGLILEYAIQAVIVKVAQVTFREVEALFRPPDVKKMSSSHSSLSST